MTYISGPITGVDGWQEKFIQAEKRVKENLDRHIRSPRLIGLELERELGKGPEEIPWSEYMRADLRYLTWCDAIYMMDGWQGSRGCQLEHHVANQLGLDIHYQEDRCQG